MSSLKESIISMMELYKTCVINMIIYMRRVDIMQGQGPSLQAFFDIKCIQFKSVLTCFPQTNILAAAAPFADKIDSQGSKSINRSHRICQKFAEH